MPKSKRQRVVHMSKVTKKDKESKQALFSKIQEAADSHSHIFVFGVEHMRNIFLKNVRAEFASDSRLFFGKTKVMAKALGAGPEDEVHPGVSGLGKFLAGDVGLLCTDRDVEAVREYFEEYSELDFARAGAQATRTFVVPAGQVFSRGGDIPAEDDVVLPHSVEVTLRKWGMPTKLDKGRIMLDSDYTLCTEGETLNSNQTALLKMFGVTMAEFKVQILAYWTTATKQVTVIDQNELEMDN